MSAFVPIKAGGVDTTAPIWELVWPVKIKQIDLVTENEIREFGMPTVFDEAIDKELSRQWVDIYIPIVKMVEYYQRGVYIRITNYDDVEKIYSYIEDHLQAWANALNYQLNIGNAPVEDLIAMNEFANGIYPLARPYFKGIDAGSALMRAMRKVGLVGTESLLRPPDEAQPTSAEEDVAQRRDLAPIFIRGVDSINSYKS